MWAYVTTSKSMEPLYHPVVHPLTNQKPLMGIVHAQAKRENEPKLGSRVNIWQANFYRPSYIKN